MSPDAFLQWRRRLLVAAGCAAVAPVPAAPPPQSAASDVLKELLAERRSSWLVRGGAQLEATYWSAERGYDRDQYLQICWALRDIQADRVFPIDHGLLDVLAGLQAWLAKGGVRAPLEIHSGYRTHSTNQNRGRGAQLTAPAGQGCRRHGARRQERRLSSQGSIAVPGL